MCLMKSLNMRHVIDISIAEERDSPKTFYLVANE